MQPFYPDLKVFFAAVQMNGNVFQRDMVLCIDFRAESGYNNCKHLHKIYPSLAALSRDSLLVYIITSSPARRTREPLGMMIFFSRFTMTISD